MTVTDINTTESESDKSQEGLHCAITINLHLQQGAELESFNGEFVADKVNAFIKDLDEGILTWDYHVVVGHGLVTGSRGYDGFESEILFEPGVDEDAASFD